MIVRIWKGWTTPENAAAYEELLEDVARFAGLDVGQAVVPDRVQQLMSHYDQAVLHHEVVL